MPSWHGLKLVMMNYLLLYVVLGVLVFCGGVLHFLKTVYF